MCAAAWKTISGLKPLKRKSGEHKWDEGKVTKKATCLKDGEKTYTCTRCGETKKEKVKAYGSHNWDEGNVTKKANCTEKGEKTVV